MRRYRAWDKEAKAYIEHGFDIRIDGNGYVYRRIWGESEWQRTSDLIIEWRSGKFDIDNKEVFAGDKSKGHGVLVFTTDGIEGTTGFYWKDKEGLHHYEYLTTPVKIIGTIHSEAEDD